MVIVELLRGWLVAVCTWVLERADPDFSADLPEVLATAQAGNNALMTEVSVAKRAERHAREALAQALARVAELEGTLVRSYVLPQVVVDVLPAAMAAVESADRIGHRPMQKHAVAFRLLTTAAPTLSKPDASLALTLAHRGTKDLA